MYIKIYVRVCMYIIYIYVYVYVYVYVVIYIATTHPSPVGGGITNRVVATQGDSISLFGFQTLFKCLFIFALVYVLRHGAIDQDGESHYQARLSHHN